MKTEESFKTFLGNSKKGNENGYLVTIEQQEGGTVVTDSKRVKPLESVTLNITVEDGYVLEGFHSIPSIPIYEIGAGEFEFIMPRSGVTVTPIIAEQPVTEYIITEVTNISDTANYNFSPTYGSKVRVKGNTEWLNYLIVDADARQKGVEIRSEITSVSGSGVLPPLSATYKIRWDLSEAGTVAPKTVGDYFLSEFANGAQFTVSTFDLTGLDGLTELPSHFMASFCDGSYDQGECYINGVTFPAWDDVVKANDMCFLSAFAGCINIRDYIPPKFSNLEIVGVGFMSGMFSVSGEHYSYIDPLPPVFGKLSVIGSAFMGEFGYRRQNGYCTLPDLSSVGDSIGSMILQDYRYDPYSSGVAVYAPESTNIYDRDVLSLDLGLSKNETHELRVKTAEAQSAWRALLEPGRFLARNNITNVVIEA